ncbi:MAG: hypothetical protein AB7F83_11905 [Lysobacterales bacterium]
MIAASAPKKAVFLFFFLLTSTLAGLASANETIFINEDAPLYVSFRLDSSSMDSQDEGSAYFTVDEKSNLLTVDKNYRLQNEDCNQGWLCLRGYIEFGIPKQCDDLHTGSRWEYEKRIFVVHESYVIGKGRSAREVFVINIFEVSDRLVGSALYSKKKGIETYAHLADVDGSKTIDQYVLLSDVGAARGGCIARGARASIPPR